MRKYTTKFTSHAIKIFAIVILMCFSTSALALNHTFYYGGRVIDISGKPLNGLFDVTVNFFDMQTGGNMLNAGPYNDQVNATDGIFSLPITLSAIDETAIFGTASVWIEFTNKTTTQTYPRQKLNPVPYALRVPVDGSTIIFNTDGNLQVGNVAVTQIMGLSALLAAKADVASTGSMMMGSGSTLALGGFTTAAQTVMVAGLTAADSGKTWFNTQTHQIMYWDGSNMQSVGAAGSGLTNLNGQSGSTQMLAIGSVGSAPTWSSAANTHTLNIPQASTAAVTAGLISNADYSSFSSAATKSSYLTVTAATNLDTVRSTVAGATSSNTNLTLVQRDATGSLNAATITAEAKLNLKSATTSNAISISAPAGMVATATYTLPAAAVAGALLTTDAAGTLSWISPSLIAPVSSVAGRTGAIILTSSDVSEGINEYFTAARAQSAAVVDALNSGVINTAPSQNAVFSAIAAVNTAISGKEPTITNPADTSKYYRGDKSWQTLNTASVPELTNMYYTDTRARLALSASSPLTYNNSSGAFSLPAATTSADGYLTSVDWNTFNTKQAALGYTPVNKVGDTMTGALLMKGADLRFTPAAGGNYVAFKSPSTIASSITWTLPAADGSPGQLLKTDGAGTLSWFTDSGASGTVTSVATGTGLTGGPITGSGTISLANTAVTPNTYTRANITVDAQGRLTSASNSPAIVDADISAGAAIAESKIANLTADLASKESTITNPSDTSKYYRGDKSWQTLNTASVPELTNMYYTDTRARLALSASSPLSYNNSTGSFSLPAATTSADGYLTSVDWNTFNTKQAALGYTPVNKVGDTMTGPLLMKGADLRFTPAAGGNYVAFKSPTTIASSITWTLPAADGIPGQLLKTDGAGTLSWVNDSVNAGTVTSVATGTGLTGGPITGSGTIYLANTTVTPNSYTRANITVDAQGRLTSASNSPAIVDADISASAAIAESKIANLTADLASKESTITNPSDTSKYYRGDKSWQTLNTAAVPEVTHLYYTDTRARLALSASSPLTYNNSTGAFSLPAATSSTDGYLTSTDWSTFNNKVSSPWATSGSNLYFNTGTVSVGTSTTGSSTLQVNGSLTSHGGNFEIDDAGVNDSTAVRLFSAGGNLYLQSGSGGATYFRNKTAAINMTFLDGGNLGIGTTNPIDRLDIMGTVATTTSGYPYDGMIGFFATDGQIGEIYHESNGPGFPYLGFASRTPAGGTAPLVLQQWGGNVGIGTSAANSVLTLNGNMSTYNNGASYYYTDAGSTLKGVVGLPAAGDMRIASESAGNWLRLGANASNISFWMNGNVDVDNSPQIVFNLNGNVGIGSGSPAVKLDVVGQMRSVTYTAGVNATVFDANNGNNQTSVQSGAGSGTITITFNNMADGATYTIAMQNTQGGTYSFTGSGLAWKYLPTNGATSSGKDTLYTIMRMGGTAYVTWMTGF